MVLSIKSTAKAYRGLTYDSTMPEKAAGYLRVLTQKQKENESHVRQ